MPFVQQSGCVLPSLVGIGADKLIQELTSFIISKIDNRATISGQNNRRVFVLEPSHCSALDRRAVQISRIDGESQLTDYHQWPFIESLEGETEQGEPLARVFWADGFGKAVVNDPAGDRSLILSLVAILWMIDWASKNMPAFMSAKF